MNSKLTEKMGRKLSATEDSLRRKLLKLLADSAKTGADYFTNSEFNPHYLQLAHLISETEVLLQLAKESLSLRDQLSLPQNGSVGELYLSACAEAADLQNEHRRGPRKLAAWVCQELQAV